MKDQEWYYWYNPLSLLFTLFYMRKTKTTSFMDLGRILLLPWSVTNLAEGVRWKMIAKAINLREKLENDLGDRVRSSLTFFTFLHGKYFSGGEIENIF